MEGRPAPDGRGEGRDEKLKSMSEKPKFEVIDRRKMKAEEEKEGRDGSPQEHAPEPAPGGHAPRPHLVVNEAPRETPKEPEKAAQEPGLADELPPPPTAQASHDQKAAYDASAQRLEDLIRAQNPGADAPPQVGFEHLVQQLYLTAMLQMGAGTEEGQRPRIDVIGARATIDLLGILAEKTRGNLTPAEDRMLQSVLFEARMGFLELTSMMSVQPVPPPPAGKK